VTHVIGGNSPRESVVYLPSNGWEPNRCELFIKINDEYSFKDGYERVCEQINKYYAMNNSMIATFYLQTVGGDVPIFMTIAFCAMVISLLITVSGIVGTITLDTDRRKKEVAIRKINGAGFKQIYWLFAKLYFRIYVIVALLVTFIIFYVINLQLLGEFISVSLLEWIAAYLFAALVIFISICSKIYQVARINPSELLRAE
jgi:ABC-type antimicrobial peptide transport system permease subunit